MEATPSRDRYGAVRVNVSACVYEPGPSVANAHAVRYPSVTEAAAVATPDPMVAADVDMGVNDEPLMVQERSPVSLELLPVPVHAAPCAVSVHGALERTVATCAPRSVLSTVPPPAKSVLIGIVRPKLGLVIDRKMIRSMVPVTNVPDGVQVAFATALLPQVACACAVDATATVRQRARAVLERRWSVFKVYSGVLLVESCRGGLRQDE
jgi:hypothetical protein